MKWFLLVGIFYGPYKSLEFQIQQPSEKACYAAKEIMHKQIQIGSVQTLFCVPGEEVTAHGKGGK